MSRTASDRDSEDAQDGLLLSRSAFAVLLSVVAIVGLQMLEIPGHLYAATPAIAFSVLGHCLIGVLTLLWVPCLYPLAVAASSRLRNASPRKAMGIQIALALAASGHAYWVFLHETYRGWAWGLYVVLFVFLVGSGIERSRMGSRLATVVGIGGSCVVAWYNSTTWPTRHPGLHLSLLEVEQILLATGLVQLFTLRKWPTGRLVLRASVVVGLGLLGIAVAAAVAPAEASRPLYDARTTLGRGHRAFEAYDPAREVANETVGAGELAPEQAVQRFEQQDGLPDLPADFDLGKYNVLFVVIDAARFDQTTMGGAGEDVTPSLARLAEDGAHVFRRAYSPSSGTLQSLAAMMGMGSPSTVPVEVWRRPWHGVLRPDAQTVTEVFAARGYTTFWAGHDYRRKFEGDIGGLDQGFAWRSLLPATAESVETDARIADEAIAFVQAAAKKPDPFFGWVFFISPHSEHVPHYEDMPADTPLARYRQELRYADEQAGRVLEELRRLEILDSTIVIFVADHGEEFGEHGGIHHTTTVYEESAHVPLLVRLPEGAGAVVDAPTSAGYVFPWLLLRGWPEARAAATHAVASRIAPMMEATHGAVIVELLGPQHMLSALIWRDRKLIYDFIADHAELFDLASDPGELEAQLLTDREQGEGAMQSLAGYRAQRAELRAFTLSRQPDPE